MVYLQADNGIPAFEHVLAAWQAFTWWKRPVQFFEAVQAPWLPVKAHSPIIGSVEVVRQAFQGQGLTLPPPLNVPPLLRPFAGPAPRTMTLREFYEDPLVPVFVKPAEEAKAFSGGEITNQGNKRHILGEYPDELLVHVAPAIDILSEYRVFVGRGVIKGVKHYLGDPFVPPPCQGFIETLLGTFAPEAPCAYALDVGLVEGNVPIVVECNDFWSLGTYGLDPVVYAGLCEERWRQLVTQARN